MLSEIQNYFEDFVDALFHSLGNLEVCCIPLIMGYKDSHVILHIAESKIKDTYG